MINLADEAVAQQKPVNFTSAIPQRLDQLNAQLQLYAALDPSSAATASKQVAELQTTLQERFDQHRESIIAVNELPPEHYRGPDRPELERLAIAAWKKEQPDANVLTARIPSRDWQREKLWRYQASAWDKVDRSRVQVQLIVQQNDKLAAIRPVNLWKDHLRNDQIVAIPMHGMDKPLTPQDLLPLEKVK